MLASQTAMSGIGVMNSAPNIPSPSLVRMTRSWHSGLWKNMFALAVPLGCVSFAIGILGLASPLFIMAVYDQAIGAADISVLISLASGVAAAILGAFLLRRQRQKMIGNFATHLVLQMSMTVFSQLLDIHGRSSGGDSANQGVARLQDMERLRTVFAGPIATTLADVPVVMAYGLAIFCLTPGVAFGLLILVGFAAGLQYGVARSQQGALADRQRLGVAQQAIWRQATLFWPLLARPDYRDRFLAAQIPENAELAQCQIALARIATINQLINQAGTSCAALLALTVGIEEIWQGEITTGVLIAVMMLLWRIMAPLQALFAIVPQIRMFRRALNQLDSVMRSARSKSPDVAAGNMDAATHQGDVKIERLSYRYPDMAIPALSALSLGLSTGQVTALVGPNGAGKTLLLRLIAGLERPQVGQILIGGTELRHLSGRQLEEMVAYIPPAPLHMPGKLETVLHQAAPDATDDMREAALILAFGEDWRSQWPQGLVTDTALIADSPQGAVRLALAEACLRRPRILLIDNVLEGLDPEAEFAFLTAMTQMRANSAICFVTHNRDHLAFADQAVVLQQGQIRYAGPAATVKDKIPAGLM